MSGRPSKRQKSFSAINRKPKSDRLLDRELPEGRLRIGAAFEPRSASRSRRDDSRAVLSAVRPLTSIERCMFRGVRRIRVFEAREIEQHEGDDAVGPGRVTDVRTHRLSVRRLALMATTSRSSS